MGWPKFKGDYSKWHQIVPKIEWQTLFSSFYPSSFLFSHFKFHNFRLVEESKYRCCSVYDIINWSLYSKITIVQSLLSVIVEETLFLPMAHNLHWPNKLKLNILFKINYLIVI